MRNGTITINIKCGKTLLSVLRGLRAAQSALDLVPEWHSEERDKLRRRIRKASRMVKSAMNAQS